MTASKLRWVLVGVIGLLITGFGAGVWLVQQTLSDYVRQTDHLTIDADVSTIELQQLKALEKELVDEADIVDRAKQIAASTAQYRYQDQVISDITDYAARYDISVSTFDFATNQSSAKNSTSPTGAKKTPFAVTLKGPVPFVKFLRFLQAIEKNLTKIQVTRLTLAPDKNPNKIANPNIGLEVYLKT